MLTTVRNQPKRQCHLPSACSLRHLGATAWEPSVLTWWLRQQASSHLKEDTTVLSRSLRTGSEALPFHTGKGPDVSLRRRCYEKTEPEFSQDCQRGCRIYSLLFSLALFSRRQQGTFLLATVGFLFYRASRLSLKRCCCYFSRHLEKFNNFIGQGQFFNEAVSLLLASHLHSLKWQVPEEEHKAEESQHNWGAVSFQCFPDGHFLFLVPFFLNEWQFPAEQKATIQRSALFHFLTLKRKDKKKVKVQLGKEQMRTPV